MWIPSTRPAAEAHISGGEEVPGLGGTVSFYPMWDGVMVVAQISGLPEDGEGIFGMHIHEGEDCGGTGFADSKGHYNPASQPHPEHAGDLPPLFRCCDGRAYLAVVTSRIHLRDVIGKTLIIHAMSDDFRTQPSGNSGSKIGCGVIRKN